MERQTRGVSLNDFLMPLGLAQPHMRQGYVLFGLSPLPVTYMFTPRLYRQMRIPPPLFFNLPEQEY